jgi:hypothetical protein
LHLAVMRNFTPDQQAERLLWKLIEILLNGGSET